LTIRNKVDSLLLDSIVVDKNFCEHLRQALLKLPDNSRRDSRLISNKKIYIDVVTTMKAHIHIELYLTDFTALILIKTKSKDWAEGLDDLYSSTELKEMFERI
jgi:hypothetical protein